MHTLSTYDAAICQQKHIHTAEQRFSRRILNSQQQQPPSTRGPIHKISYDLSYATKPLCIQPSHQVWTKPPGMQSSMIRCLSQARTNWEGCDRKHPAIKNWGLWGWGAVSSDMVAPTQTVGASATIIFPCSTKSRRFSWWRAIIFLDLTPWAPPHAYVNRRWGNPARTQHNPMLRQRVVFMMTLTGLINCGKAGPLGSLGQYLEYWLTDR